MRLLGGKRVLQYFCGTEQYVQHDLPCPELRRSHNRRGQQLLNRGFSIMLYRKRANWSG